MWTGIVDPTALLLLGLRRTGHPGQLVVQPEVDGLAGLLALNDATADAAACLDVPVSRRRSQGGRDPMLWLATEDGRPAP